MIFGEDDTVCNYYLMGNVHLLRFNASLLQFGLLSTLKSYLSQLVTNGCNFRVSSVDIRSMNIKMSITAILTTSYCHFGVVHQFSFDNNRFPITQKPSDRFTPNLVFY